MYVCMYTLSLGGLTRAGQLSAGADGYFATIFAKSSAIPDQFALLLASMRQSPNPELVQYRSTSSSHRNHRPALERNGRKE